MPATVSRRVLQLAVAVTVAAGAFATPAVATRSVHNFRDGRGLHLRTIRESKGPQEIRVLTLRPGRSVPDIAPADPHYQMWALTSKMSARIGAIAGVNGDFGTSKGQPKHVLMIDGELWTSGQSGGNAIAWSTNGKTAFIGHPRLKIRGRDLSRRSKFFVADWNVGAPRLGKIAGYTIRGGRSHGHRAMCSPRRPTRIGVLLDSCLSARSDGTASAGLPSSAATPSRHSLNRARRPRLGAARTGATS